MTRAARALLALVSALAVAGCSDTRSDSGPRGAESPRSSATPAAHADELHFAVIGDFGARSEAQMDIANRMCQWREERPFDLVITTGDNIYPDGAAKYFEDAFFEPYACLLDEGVQWHASLGNHDVMSDGGEAQLREPAFGIKDENYVVRESGVRFVIANSNDLDREWLEENLVTQPGDRWTVAVFHHPVFSSGWHGPTETFSDLPDLFVEAGVDLVLNGHDHLYSVTKPQEGIRYVVTGGGGANTYPCTLTEESAICEDEHHFLYVTADDDRIRVQAVPEQGKPLDTFTTSGID